MGWNKPLTEVEASYIENQWPALSCAEIAEKLGRTPACVRIWVNKLGLRERQRNDAPARAEEGDDCSVSVDGDKQDELEELRELKKLLKRSMREDAGPQSLPKLSAEFREVVNRIGQIENERSGDGGCDTVARGQPESLLVSIPLRPA